MLASQFSTIGQLRVLGEFVPGRMGPHQFGEQARQFLNVHFPGLRVNELAAVELAGRTLLLLGFGRIGRAERLRAQEALATVGLTGFENRSIRTLSGGQLQRLLFARLMLQNAELILLDEPFTAIDSRTIEDLLVIVHRWHREGRTVLAVLHDLELVRTHFPETLLLARDLLGWGKTEQVLTDANLVAARKMAEAFDRNAAECHRAA